MKIILMISLVFFASYSSAAFSAETNTGVIRVSVIKAQTKDSPFYHYKFTGDLQSGANCNNRSGWPINSGDTNVNQLLQMAYISGISIKAGIDESSGCNVTAVELQP